MISRSAAVSAGPDVFAALRIQLTYAWRMRRLADLDAPRRFTELVQLRKLYDRDPALPPLLDKVAVKSAVADALGPEWTIPTAWQGSALPDALPFAAPAILKARHGCNQNRVLGQVPGAREHAALQQTTARWTARPYGEWLDEWAYRDVPRGLIAEPLLDDGGVLPVDYKIYAFAGRATHVQVHVDRARDHRWHLHDRDFRPLVAGAETVRRPASLNAMLGAAETLAAGHSFLRVDFYEIAGRPMFGEFCIYPGSGLDRFAADWIDIELGALWRDALGHAPVLSEPSHAPSGVPAFAP